MDTSAHTLMAADEEAEALSYKPVSKLAIASLLLGLVSVLTWVAIGLAIIPIVAIVLGLLAWRKTSRGEAIGQTPALIGVGLATFFIASAVGLQLSENDEQVTASREFTDQFVELLYEDKFDEAFQYSYAARNDGKPPSKTFAQYYATRPVVREARDDLANSDLLTEILTTKGEFQFVSSEVVRRTRGENATVLHSYRYTYTNDDGPQWTNVDIAIEGRMEKSAMRWYVVSIDRDYERKF